jgi:WD40 repeat protein
MKQYYSLLLPVILLTFFTASAEKRFQSNRNASLDVAKEHSPNKGNMTLRLSMPPQFRSVIHRPISRKKDFILQLKATLPTKTKQATSVAFSPDNQLLVTGGFREESTELWDTASGQLIAELDGAMRLMADGGEIDPFSSDSRFVFTTSGKDARLWDAATGRLKFVLRGHEKDVISAAFSPDNMLLATGSEDGTVKLWNTQTGEPITTLTVWRVKKIPRYRILSRALNVPIRIYVKFSPNGSSLLTNVEWEGSPAKLWETATGRLLAELAGHTTTVGNTTETAGVSSAKYSPDGKFVVTASGGHVKLWETVSGRLVKELLIWSDPPSFSLDSRLLGFVRGEGGDGSALLNVETLELLPISDVDPSYLSDQAFSQDSRTFVAASGYKKRYATLVDVATGRVNAKIPLVAKWGFDLVSDYLKDVDTLSFRPSSQILMGANLNSVKFWDATNGQLLHELKEARRPAKFSSDGRTLATAGRNNTILLWNTPK